MQIVNMIQAFFEIWLWVALGTIVVAVPMVAVIVATSEGIPASQTTKSKT